MVRDGQLQVLTHDHTLAQTLIDGGQLRPDEAERSSLRHVLTRNLGDAPGVQADLLELSLHAGDRVLLCSDGLSGCVSSEAIQRVLSTAAPPDEMARALVALALNSGDATDNISALVLMHDEADLTHRTASAAALPLQATGDM
jgi:protein phosphatase